MGRKAKAVRKEWTWYVPDVHGNREDKDPVAVETRAISAGEYQGIEAEQIAIAAAEGGDIDFRARARAIIRRMFELCTRGVRNYEMEDRAVVSGAELYAEIMERGDKDETDWIDDIVSAIHSQSRLEAGALERLSLRSDSSTQGTPRLSGGAASDAGDGTLQMRSTTQHVDKLETATERQTTASPGNGLRL